MKKKLPSIATIERRTKARSPYYFSKDTLEIFDQTMSSFVVERSPGGKIFIYAPCKYRGKIIGYSFREYTGSQLKPPPLPQPVTMLDIHEYIQSN